MSTTLNIKAVTDNQNPEFQKHFKAVKFCIENDLSYPKETSKFFKGALDGEDLEDIRNDFVLDYIQYGISVDISDLVRTDDKGRKLITLSELPDNVDRIVIINE